MGPLLVIAYTVPLYQSLINDLLMNEMKKVS